MKMINQTLSLLAFAALPALSGCGTGEASVVDADAIRQATPVPVEVSFPVRADIYATYSATTTIGSEGDAPVLARVPGEERVLPQRHRGTETQSNQPKGHEGLRATRAEKLSWFFSVPLCLCGSVRCI